MVASPEQSLFIAGPAGRIQGMWLPSSSNSGLAAVICHPHPLYGGSMDNKVVTTLARVWRDAGVSVLRFNFRGVGGSEGQHAHGVGEIEDLLAVLHWLQAEKEVGRVTLAGFSFGAWVTAAAASRLPAGLALERLVLVAPPVHYEGFASLQPPPDTLVIQGEDDDVVQPDAVYEWVASRRHRPELLRFSGAGHFFHGRLTDLKAELAARLGTGL